jgi:hypothetical protein
MGTGIMRSFHNAYTSPNIVLEIRSINTKWEIHVASIREMNIYNILDGNLEGRKPSYR